MGIDIRLPNINASTEREQLVQMKSYLYQLAEQLQWAMQNVEASTNTVVASPAARSLMPSTSSGVTSPEATFSSIKELIIKSADIVDAYYEEINKKLKGIYVAESDFGTYKQETTADITKTSTDVTTAFSNIQEVITSIGTVKDELSGDIKDLDDSLKPLDSYIVDVKSHIKMGELDEVGGIPIYGIEIGQTTKINGRETFNKFARFTADRLSFYDQNGFEAAYISDSKLYISNVEITSSYKIGGYVDTVTSNGGVVTKWVGRS